MFALSTTKNTYTLNATSTKTSQLKQNENSFTQKVLASMAWDNIWYKTAPPNENVQPPIENITAAFKTKNLLPAAHLGRHLPTITALLNDTKICETTATEICELSFTLRASYVEIWKQVHQLLRLSRRR